MNEEQKKQYQAKTEVLKALAHPTRLWIVDQLSEGERCVCEFVDQIGADVSTISKHLSLLKNAGIIVSEKRGKWVFYSLKTPCVLGFSQCIENVLTHHIQDKIDSLS